MVLSLADFIGYLRQRDFNVGVEHLLRAQVLLETIDQDFPSKELLDALRQEHSSDEILGPLLKDYPPDKLKIRLCPLFAVNREEQLRFYRVFDDYINYVVSPTPIVQDGTSVVPQSRWKGPGLVLTVVGGVLLATLLMVYFLRKPDRLATWLRLSPSPTPTPTSTRPPPSPIQSPTVIPSPTGSLSSQPSPWPSLASPPSPRATTQPTPPRKPPPAKAYFPVFVAGLVLFFLFELVGNLKRKRLLRTQQSKSPPFSWPLTVKKPRLQLYSSERFFQAVRRLRRRRIAEYHRLHIPATIAATIRSLGYPSFRYKPDSTIPEYLMLIDRASFRDHQAHLFNELFKALKREGLYIVRFFYDQDPSRCFDEKGKDFHYLSELRSKYFDHRLLIFGDGEKLLDPVTGKLAEWVEMFSAWHDRALFTPVTPGQWAFREAQLVTQFSLLPATVEGLQALAEFFAPPITRELRQWNYSEADVLPRHLDVEHVVTELRPRLGEDVFQWVCACAVYQELQWDLTLQIGSLPCMTPGLLNEENLQRLVRLPWFIAGTIPEDIRLSLIDALDKDKEAAVRALLINVLAKDEPPAGTFVADTRSLELELQRYLFSRDAESLRSLRLALKNIPENEILNDRFLVHYLKEVPASALARLLPSPLRRGLYKHGLPLFGFKRAVHFLVMLLCVLLVSLSMRAGAIPVLYPPPAQASSPSPTPAAEISPTPQLGLPSSPTASPTPSGSPTPSESPSPSPTGSPSPSPLPSPGLIRLRASDDSITLSCPQRETPAKCASVDSITLQAESKGNVLVYKWYVTGGRIIGEGATVKWDLTGVSEGNYIARVDAEYGHSQDTSETAVTVSECRYCQFSGGCPRLPVSCPDSVVEGQPLTFTANASPEVSGFRWSVSAGKIMSGQNTPSIKVDTTGLRGQTVTVVVEGGGIPAECLQSFSCSTQVTGPPTPPRPSDFKAEVNVLRGGSSAKPTRTVIFTSEPAGAKVTVVPQAFLSDQSKYQQLPGVTNMQVVLPVGRYHIIFELNGEKVTKAVMVE
jgi:hypothetical protein